MDNKRIWDKLRTPPKNALKEITGGRLKGMTDIKPQWRYDALTENFGPCGEGWNYTIEKLWTEAGIEGQVFAFALIEFKYKEGETWSEPIPGIGGSMLVEKEKYGLHHNDEAFKMAVTDALSVAVKMIGVGADIYMGNAKGDGGKYNKPKQEEKKSEEISVDIIKDYLPNCDTIKTLNNYYAKNKKFIAGLLDKENSEVIAAFTKRKEEIEGGKA